MSASLILLASPPSTAAEPKASSTVEELPNSMLPPEGDVPRPAPAPVATTSGEDPELARKRIPPSIWIPATAGGAMMMGGLTLYMMAKHHEGRLIDGDLTSTPTRRSTRWSGWASGTRPSA